MCGIAGFLGPGDQGDLERMTRSLSHRGPDGEGYKIFAADALHFGHRRLSIVDLDGGAQPMRNEDASVWVTFNGEIYNHAELRAELQACGHTFATDHSDTEVLVHGWEEWGEDLARRLNGMFAFAIWDSNKKTLHLARDRFGEKPLYWGHGNWGQGNRAEGELFLFASELSAFNQHRAFKAELDPLSLKKYFAHGFIPAPNAAYQGTHKLQPGHWLTLKPGQPPKLQAYWRFRIEIDPRPPSLEEAAEEVRARILTSVKRRMMSDVPLGVFLSGGVDSSTAAAAMCQFRAPESVESFCIGFNEASYDESPHARAMAETLGIHHFEDILSLDVARDLIGDVLSRMDEPLADGSILPTYLLSKFARKRVTVALSGDGGDELFAGYDPFKALKPAMLYNALMPRPAHKALRSLAEWMPKSAKNMSLDFKVRRALQGLDYGPELWNPAWLAPLEASDIQDLFNEPVAIEELYGEALSLWRQSGDLGLTDKTLEFYSNFYLPDDILTKVDRASMLNGLETRSIFLDNDLVEFTRKLPASYKFDGKVRKKVLKKAVEGLVPQDILLRPKKGFGVPMQTWMRELPITALHAERFGLNSHEIDARIQSHKSGRADHRLFLWAWTALQHFGQDQTPGSTS